MPTLIRPRHCGNPASRFVFRACQSFGAEAAFLITGAITTYPGPLVGGRAELPKIIKKANGGSSRTNAAHQPQVTVGICPTHSIPANTRFGGGTAASLYSKDTILFNSG